MGKIKEIKINNIKEIELIIKRDTRYRVRNRANAILYKFKMNNPAASNGVSLVDEF